MSRPVADQPTRSGAHGRPPAGDRPAQPAGQDHGAPVAPLTVAELLARQGGDVPRRRRAGRRESAETNGRPEPVGDGGRPPLLGSPRQDPGPLPASPSPTVLPTGWQPAMPAPQPGPADEEPAGPRPVDPGPWAARSSVVPPAVVPPAVVPGEVRSAPASWPTPPAPSLPLTPVPPRPAMRAVPADPPAAGPASIPPHSTPSLSTPLARPAPRVVPPVPVTPSPTALPPAAPGAPPRPAAAPAAPYQSAPVPGVRRSLPVPPIPGRDVPAPAGAGAGRAPMSRGRRRLVRAALALLAVLGMVTAYYVGLYFYVDRSISRVDALITDGPEVLAPQLQQSAQTYLVVGTGLPGRSGPAAVSALIAHVSDDGSHAVLVTVPPTALGDTPTCRDDDGDVRPAVTEPFASALLDGGPSCLVRSVQQLTGLRVDHYLALDLDQLPGMVDALGDVAVCQPAGDERLRGEDVAAYLSPAGAVSDVTGSAAAGREQRVLTSTLRTALAGATLTDPLTLTRFLTRAAGAFTVDADTTLGDVRALGSTLGRLSGDEVESAELPVAQVGYVPTGSDQAAVVVDAAATRELFDAVIDSGRLPAGAEPGTDPAAGAPATGGTAPTGAPGTQPADSLPDPALTDPVPAGTTVTVPPAGVTVDVLDATGGSRTAEVAGGLAAEGFRIGTRGVEPAAVSRTVVRYGPAALEPARTVAAAVPGAVLLETDEVGGAVQLVVGPDYAGLSPVAVGTPVPTAAAPPSVAAEAGATSSCS